LTKWKNPVSGYFFILPWLVGFLLLTAWPMAQSVYFSLTDYSLLEAPRWLGTANYVKIFTDDSSFTTAVAVTSAFVALVVPQGRHRRQLPDGGAKGLGTVHWR